jgi:hypothetical protein
MAHRAPAIDDEIIDAVRQDDIDSFIAEAGQRRAERDEQDALGPEMPHSALQLSDDQAAEIKRRVVSPDRKFISLQELDKRLRRLGA